MDWSAPVKLALCALPCLSNHAFRASPPAGHGQAELYESAIRGDACPPSPGGSRAVLRNP
jgi:hypothetical protein